MSSPSPTPSPTTPLIACINSSQDITNLLRDVLVDEGFRAVPYTSSHEEGPQKLRTFLQHLLPKVVIFTVSPPYPDGWQELLQLQTALPGCGWVVTTTNKRALDEVAGPTTAIEVIGKPFDLDQIVAAVRHCLDGATG